MSITESNATQSDFYAYMERRYGDPRPDATPTWDDLTEAERDEHRSECLGTCGFCDTHRAWGECGSCGEGVEALGADELSRCCGSRVYIAGPELDDLREWRAA